MLLAIWCLCSFYLTGCRKQTREAVYKEPLPDEEPSPERTPTEELATFNISKGLKIELVAAEPMVQDPVVITFDEDGRLWVVEMRGFMPDIDGAGEKNPVGRISVLEDTDGDGQMDASKIYIDSLIMPRAIGLVPHGALIAENEALWLTQDLNNDLQADTKTLIDPHYAGSALPEHSGNGLLRGIDNWYYNAKSRFRYRFVEGKWQRDSTEFRGQWGISHDDEGRLYYNYNWSQLHADLVPPNYLSRNKNHTPTTGIDHGLTIDRRVYPIRPNQAVNRGYIPGTLDQEGHLLEFTAACSPLYYRGTALPKAYYGSVFVCEPSGNLIKRNVVTETDYVLSAHDPQPGKEFLASIDERFRPVHLATGPDGALYVADMYRGLIQHGAYVTPYLREQTISRKLVQPINRGRIWRIVPENYTPSKPQKLSEASTDKLVLYLSHPNGWHRDMAQRLLVERSDESIKNTLTDLALKGNNVFGRFHALWTLEGLDLLGPDLLLPLLYDNNILISNTAIRLLESYAKQDPGIRSKLESELLNISAGAEPKQILQIALTSGVLNSDVSHQILAGICERYDTSALMRDAVLSSIGNNELSFLKTILKSPQWQSHSASREIFLELITTAILKKGDKDELTILLSLLNVNKDLFGWKEKSILTALSIHGSGGKFKTVRLIKAPGIFTRNDIEIPPSRLEVLHAMFEWPGHKASVSRIAKKHPLNEKEQQQFALGRQHYLTTCAGCHGTDGAGLSRFAPPLIGSEWVLGDEKRLALIVLHGIEGAIEVNGKRYDAPAILPVMPSHSVMDDRSISSILTYIRNEWGNDAGPVSNRVVSTTRHTSQGRVVPWTPAELNKYIEDTKTSEAQ